MMNAKSLRHARTLACAFAAASLLAQPTMAADPPRAKATVEDVGLDPSSLLHGRVVNKQDVGWAKETVLLRNERTGQSHSTVTDDKGRFSFKAPSGGVYSLTAGRSSKVVRAWPAEAAPPKSNSGVRIVADNMATRRQIGQILFLGTAAAAIVIPVVTLSQSGS